MVQKLSTVQGRKEAVEGSQIGQGATITWPEEQDRRKNQVLQHMETELFAAANGDFDRAHLLIAALIERPAVKVMPSHSLRFKESMYPN